MGGGVSSLRAQVREHVRLTQKYPNYIEPYLAALQFFLRTAECGEGIGSDELVGDLSTDAVITDKTIFTHASTEVEVLAENPAVMKALIQAIVTYRELQVAPELDPFPYRFEIPWMKGRRPMEKYLQMPHDQLERFQVSVLRTSIRCLRLVMLCPNAKSELENCNGPDILTATAAANPLDEFIQRDIEAIFRLAYGGEMAVRRIALGGIPVISEMMHKNVDSAVIQLAAVRRLCGLLREAGVGVNRNNDKGIDFDDPDAKVKVDSIFRDLDDHDIVRVAVGSFAKFDVDEFAMLFIHICRFILLIAERERNAKLVGQAGGVQGAITLLLKARELHRDLTEAEKEEHARKARLENVPVGVNWESIINRNKPEEPAIVEHWASEDLSKVSNIKELARIEYTPAEVGQLAIWTLDLLAAVDYNVGLMKQHRLKYLLTEIKIDPNGKEMGKALLITRKLRYIRWDEQT